MVFWAPSRSSQRRTEQLILAFRLALHTPPPPPPPSHFSLITSCTLFFSALLSKSQTQKSRSHYCFCINPPPSTSAHSVSILLNSQFMFLTDFSFQVVWFPSNELLEFNCNFLSINFQTFFSFSIFPLYRNIFFQLINFSLKFSRWF